MVEERALVALYKTAEAAERARAALLDLGIPPDQVSFSGEERAGSTADYQPRDDSDDGGFFQAIKDLFLPESDAYSYGEGVRRGAKMVTAHVPGELVDRAIALMEREDPIDIDAGESEWRTAGWSDYGRTEVTPEDRGRRRDGARTGRVRSYMR